jgi:DNA uptake protein ComE-like DNA-binding protein
MFQGNPFDMSMRHQRGIWVLLIASVLIIFAPRFFLFLQKDDSATKLILLPVEDKPKWNTTRKFNVWNIPYKKRTWPHSKKTFKKPAKPFNPNELSIDEWMQFGLSEKQASIVLKFTKRGIHSNEELQKIKFIPQKIYDNIKDFTQYPIQESESTIKLPSKGMSSPALVNANEASEEELMKIKGLGPFYARQIIKYQNQLGGFVRKEQILEVWKMTPEIYAEIEAQISCEASKIRKLSINQASAEELQAHPYLNWNQANSIVKMRIQKGGFKSIEEIRESVIIDQETFEKVRPYLSL